MAKHFIIESPDGTEEQHVRSLDGYDDWTVIDETNVTPKPYQVWDRAQKKWKANAAKKAEDDFDSEARDRRKTLKLLKDLAARVEVLEAKLADK